ncbi:MAG: alanine racemase [Bifidobacteriaceae bacterium]|jgi:D-serine deaminase-like pyridoxal phosphate-dependent protein|nr:alanine racemase [Bifidobacteriaceae bacterium]
MKENLHSDSNKSFPPSIEAEPLLGAQESSLTVRDLWTPTFVLAKDRIEHNATWMATWCSGLSVELMPHGKTTMSPELWKLQLERGATGITVATPWQLSVAVSQGITSIQLANQVTDQKAIAWIAGVKAHAQAEGKALHIWSWIDDVRTVKLVENVLNDAPTSYKLDVLLDLGRKGKRTGARSIIEAIEVAKAVHKSPRLRLAGVAGYEGAIVNGRNPATEATVKSYIEDIVTLHQKISSFYDTNDVLVSAGGSAFPDIVAGVFHEAITDRNIPEARYVLRSGTYLIHDDGFYHRMSPFDKNGLLPAGRGVTRIVSQPESGLALLDGGKRDFPYDEGFPIPLYFQRSGSDYAEKIFSDAAIFAMNDQHAFMHFDETLHLSPGDLVFIGLSHPCTMFDKWRDIPLVDSFSQTNGIPELKTAVKSFIHTDF